MTDAQGGDGRGRLLVKSPAGSPAFINTGLVLTTNTCYQIQVALNNVTNTVTLSIDGVPRVTTPRLSPNAARMDAFRVEQAPNGQATGNFSRLGLDNFALCTAGAALSIPEPDCNQNCLDDRVEPDCNTNGIADECDIVEGTGPDCNGAGTPDVCQTDCNANGVEDSCDISIGTSADCNANSTPDECDLTFGTSQDCTSNGTPDECEPDCDQDGVPDSCDPTPPEVFDYGPPCDEEARQIVLDHHAAEEAIVPDPDECARAERDLDLIRDAFPEFKGATHAPGDHEPNVILIETLTPDDPRLICTNRYYQVSFQPAGFDDWWIVTFPRAVNAPAMAEIYRAHPAVLEATINVYGCLQSGCCGSSQWSYAPMPWGAWRWTFFSQYWTWRPACVSSTSYFNVSAAGQASRSSGPVHGQAESLPCEGTPESLDCNGDGTPDECQLDCNTNGIEDSCDVAFGASLDCNSNGVPDECDIGKASLHWSEQNVAAPSPRSGPAMAYDSARGVTVLFGGASGSPNQPLGETWEWDSRSWQLRATNGPSPRYLHKMVYDSGRGVTVLFGGEAGGSRNSETWEWNGSSWHLRAIGAPGSRSGHAMAYDSARSVTVLYGGFDASYPFENNETWEWDGNAWTLRDMAGPGPLYYPAMAYDSARGMAALFGDYYDGRTWEWDGYAWSERAVTGPGPRHRHAMAYDEARGVTTLFGGYVSGQASNEVWEWDGGGWEYRTAVGPSPRSNPGLVYDRTRSVSVLFGGYTDDTPHHNGETWLWSPNSPDCNNNGIPDECDIASGAAGDDDADGVPDSCETYNDFDYAGHVDDDLQVISIPLAADEQ